MLSLSYKTDISLTLVYPDHSTEQYNIPKILDTYTVEWVVFAVVLFCDFYGNLVLTKLILSVGCIPELVISNYSFWTIFGTHRNFSLQYDTNFNIYIKSCFCLFPSSLFFEVFMSEIKLFM